jgi:drug/metabolite transporter (DMT)-like permease
MTESRSGLLALYLAIILLSLNGLFAKLIPLDATSIIQLRSVVAVFAIAVSMVLQKRSLKLRCMGHYPGVYGLGLLLGLHWISFYYAMQVSSVAVGMLAMFTFPVITILLEPLFTGKQLKATDLLAGISVLAGLLIMVGGDLISLDKPVTLGAVSGLLSALLFSLRNLLQKYAFANESSDGLMLHQVFAISIFLAGFLDFQRVQALEMGSVANIVLLGILSTAAAHTLLSYSLKHLSAKSVALIQCAQPLLAAILAWAVINEMPGFPVLLGGAVILSVAVFESLRKTRTD